MGDWTDIEQAIRSPGLRIVLTPGVPGPYSEAAKGILHVKKLSYIKAKQEILGANVALQRWTAQTTAPVAAWNDEPPRSTWIEQLYLFERLAPEPRLIPADFDERTTMIGLAHEIFGEGGWVWNRRFLQVRDWSTPARAEEIRALFVKLGQKYWCTPEGIRGAPARCAEIMGRLAARLEAQQARGSRYLVGSSLTAADIYWAASAAMIEPLPEDVCPMGQLFRDVYTVEDPVVENAAVPILMRHRDFIYERHLELPIDLKT